MCKTIILKLSECDAATLYEIIAGAEYPIGSDESFVGHDVLCEIKKQLDNKTTEVEYDNDNAVTITLSDEDATEFLKNVVQNSNKIRQAIKDCK